MKRHIRARILFAFLSVSIVSLLLTAAFFEAGMFRLRALSTESSQRVGTQAADGSERALLDQSETDTAALVLSKAQGISLRMESIADSLSLICGYAGHLYSHPEQFGPVPYAAARDNPHGELAMQWVLSPGMSIDDPGIRDETYLHGNMESVYQSVMRSHPSVCTIYFTTETGINSGYDAYSDTKPSYFEGRTLDWYTHARDSGGLYVSETYQDSFGRGLMVSMSMPCYGAEDRFVGVIGLDILIEDLNREILQTTVGEHGYAMLFSREGSLICAPGLSEGERGSRTAAEKRLGSAAGVLLNELSEGKTAAERSELDGGEVYIFTAPVELTGWSMAMVLPVEDIVAPARAVREQITRMTQESAQQADRQILRSNLWAVLLFAAVIAGVAVLTSLLSRKITRPIVQLNDSVRSVSGGNLDIRFDIHTGDEIESLSLSFSAMMQELKAYMENLSRVTADKERIATELAVATQIQTSMLPCIFPAFPDRDEFDVYATMQAAKEVGGDFYDFFLIDRTHLGVVIADVSGKGVPAALFMVIAKTLIKNHAQAGMQPAEVFETVNNQLCENNEAGMFVTAFMGILEIGSGRFTYVNAGHNPPLLSRGGEPYDWLPSKRGFVLAGMEQMRYRQQEVLLAPGDSLFLYTDGVTEALNPREELYSEARLLELFRSGRLDGLSLEEQLALVREDIAAFADGAEQADDITMLILKLNEGGDGHG